MAKEKEKDDDKGKPEELVIVTADEKNLDVAPSSERPQVDEGDVPRQPREKPKEADDEDREEEENEEEARLGASEETEAEQEAKERQRSTHKSRRQRQKEAERRLKLERDFLEKRNEDLEKRLAKLEKRQGSSERQGLEQRIAAIKTQIARAEKIHADAIAQNKGEEATEALKIRDNMRDHLQTATSRLETLVKEESEAPDRPEPPRPEVIENARRWMGRTPWFDPHLRDRDSKIVRALDISLEEDGLDPGTPEYFEELDKLIAKHLPHRARKAKTRDDADEDYEDEEEPPPRQKGRANGSRRPTGGPRFRTGGPGRELKANEVFLNEDRISAMKEAGAWEDPVLRQKYLKRYQEWDRENAHLLDRDR